MNDGASRAERSRAANLERLLATGKRRFVVTYGVIGWGLTTGVIWTLAMHFVFDFWAGTGWGFPLVMLVTIWPLGGWLWGLVMWRFFTRRAQG